MQVVGLQWIKDKRVREWERQSRSSYDAPHGEPGLHLPEHSGALRSLAPFATQRPKDGWQTSGMSLIVLHCSEHF